MDWLSDSVVTTLSYPLPFIHKYVDDSIIAVPGGRIQETLLGSNRFNPSIQFKVER